MKGMLIDITKGFKPLSTRLDDIIYGPNGEMSFFPLCCSTGILKNLTAYTVKAGDATYFDKIENNQSMPSVDEIKKAKYLHQLIRAVRINKRYIFPLEAAQWYAMSLIYGKIKDGKDDGPSGGYNNYKAAQIAFFDRTLDDKEPGKFRFSYNMTYSCDHLMSWLEQTNGAFGEVLVSTAKPGGHGAKVRGCIFTPDIGAMKTYHDKYFKLVKDHIIATTKFLESFKEGEKTLW